MKLNNKRIVITGGTSGIGYQLVSLLNSNNEVIVIAKDPDKIKSLVNEYKEVVAYKTDLSKQQEIELTADKIIERYGYIDLLINNAAVQYTPCFLDDNFNPKGIEHEIAVNFTAICSLCYKLLPSLLHENKAIILNVNSGLALAPKTESAVYCATKSAMTNFTIALRYQLEKTNIDVQQAFLVIVETAMTEGRGRKKITAAAAAKKIIHGINKEINDHDIGKVKLLRFLLRLAPSLAKKIMK